MQVRNGVAAPELGDVRWRKSSESNPSGNCADHVGTRICQPEPDRPRRRGRAVGRKLGQRVPQRVRQ